MSGETPGAEDRIANAGDVAAIKIWQEKCAYAVRQ